MLQRPSSHSRSSDYIQPALGRDLIRTFRHQRNGVRLRPQRDPDHLVGRGHLDVKIGRHDVAQQLDIAVLNVPPVLRR